MSLAARQAVLDRRRGSRDCFPLPLTSEQIHAGERRERIQAELAELDRKRRESKRKGTAA